jgi:hypothetical protein
MEASVHIDGKKVAERVSAIQRSRLTISLELAHGGECADFAQPLLIQLRDGNYGTCSVMTLPPSLEAWRAAHRTARKRADRCLRRGYRFVPHADRAARADEIHEINLSSSERQGRPMSASYYEMPSKTPDPEWSCERHGVHPYGVESSGGILVAYLWIYRAGDLLLVSQILGHDAFLEDEIMYLLWQGMLMSEPTEDGFVVYNRHDSGTDGLRFYKERVGLAPTPVRWVA